MRLVASCVTALSFIRHKNYFIKNINDVTIKVKQCKQKVHRLDVKERTFIVKLFLKEDELFWYTENLGMYSKSSRTINIKHIYTLFTNLCDQDVYLMRIKGWPKAARN